MFLHFTTLRVAQDDAPGHSEGGTVETTALSSQPASAHMSLPLTPAPRAHRDARLIVR